MGSGSDGQRFLDNRTIEGTIPQMLEEAWSFVARNTRTASAVHGLKRENVPEYPEVAVREMLANALTHRDYGPYAIGTPVRLVVYSNRIECTNPGGIFGGNSVASLGRESLPTRNPTLISLLETTGDVENRHSGIPAMRDAMTNSGLREPDFTERRGTFKCTLHGERVEPRGESVLNERRILEFCQEPRTREEIARELGLKPDTARRTRILPLVRAGKLALTLPETPRSKFQRFVTVR